MPTLPTDDPLAVAATAAIHHGDVDELARLLADHPELATSRIGDEHPGGTARTLLHVLTDWPGHFPRGADTVAVLVAADADVDARLHGPHVETPLHWAASSDDIEVLDALLDAGADIEAPGAVLGGGTPLTDARGFGQWRAAHRLVERGARTSLIDAAALGLIDRVREFLADGPDREVLNDAFWGACHGGQRACAEVLLAHGADIDWRPGWDGTTTPLDVAVGEDATEVAAWLREHGARTAAELGQ